MIRASGGARIGWDDLPGRVRGAVEDVLGDRVVSAVSQAGGFSPGTADRVVTGSGARAFVKAVSSDLNPVSPLLHRKEIAAASVLPPGPVPRFLGSYDDGKWVALVLEDVEGRHPVTPWRPDELEVVLQVLGQIASTMPAPASLPSATEEFADVFGGWQRLLDDPDPDLDLDLGQVAALRDGAVQTLLLTAGNSLVHQDLRADNLLLTRAGTAVLVDWPNACRGAPWLDSLLLLINVRLYGGLDATALLRRLAAQHDIPVARMVAVLTACAGYFLDAARQPPPPALPTLRAFQQAQADALTTWLGELGQG